MNNKDRYPILAALFLALTFFLLFDFRAADDNRLASWQWVFADADVLNASAMLVPVIILSFFFSKFQVEKLNPVLFLFLSSYATAAFFWGGPEPIVDASRYFTQAKHLEVYGAGYFVKEWGRSIAAWTDMPVVPFFYGLVFKFLGESRLYIQAFTTLLFSATVVLTCKTGEELYDRETGLTAGCLLLGIPYLYTQVPLMLVDVPTMFFFTLSIFLFLKALRQGGGLTVMFSSFAIFFTMFSKYSTWMMLTVLVVIVIVRLWRDKGSRSVILRRSFVIASITALFAGAFFIYKYDFFSEQMKLLVSYQGPGLKRWGESFISTFLFQVHPWITAAAAYSCYRAFKERDARYLIISYLVFLVILMNIKRSRYIIMIFPMLALMASYGLQKISSRELRRYVVSCIVFSSVAVAYLAYVPFIGKISSVNLKEAGEYLDSLSVSNAEVYTMQPQDAVVNQAVSVPLLDLFTDKAVCYRYDPEFYPRPADFLVSSLRFTWEYRNPSYYSDSCKNTDRTALVLILNDTDEPLPDFIRKRINGYRESRMFKISEGIFSYQTIVKVFHR